MLRDFNLPIFDRGDAQKIENEIERLEKDHADDDFEEVLQEFSVGDIPGRYKVALLKQLCGRYYSLTGTSVGYLQPYGRALERVRRRLSTDVPDLTPDDVAQLAVLWIEELADRYALDRDMPDEVRALAAGYWSNGWGTDGRFERTLRARLPDILQMLPPTVETIEAAFIDEFGLRGTNGNVFLDPSKVSISIDLQMPWHQCGECTALLPVTLRGHCGACGLENVQAIDPAASEYIRARKGFWREPVAAALAARTRLRSILVEEHTAQLSNRDNARVHATTEQFELRFKDIQLLDRDKPIDVLSCTTTMEVGVVSPRCGWPKKCPSTTRELPATGWARGPPRLLRLVGPNLRAKRAA